MKTSGSSSRLLEPAFRLVARRPTCAWARPSARAAGPGPRRTCRRAVRLSSPACQDIAESRAFAEEVFNIVGADRSVFDPLAAGVGPESAAAHRARLDARGLRRGPVLAELVVQLPLLRVREHLMGFRQLLEACLRLLVAGVQIGVVLACELAEGGGDLLLRRRPRHTQHLVIVLGLRHLYLLPACGARRIPGGGRSPAPR